MTQALVIPNVGTIVLREDGSVRVVDRNRNSYEIHAEVVDAIRRLCSPAPRRNRGTLHEQDTL